MTYDELYRKGRETLEAAGVPDSRLDARLLLEHVFGITRSDLLAHGDRECPQEKIPEYCALAQKRAERIPLQHLTGEQDFMGLSFQVSDKVLIPRQDTEILVEEILKDLHGGMRILDVCTGSGCILISLLHYSNECRGVGVDLSEDALSVAQQNAARLIPDKEIHLIKSDLLEAVEGKFDILVSNPPYIPSKAVDTLMPEVRCHEPRMALDGREDGLYFYREILRQCPEHLWLGSRVFFEIGYDQGSAVKSLMEEAGFLETMVIKDYAGLDRVVCGIWKG